jgi:uncharacterized protein YqhQ
MERQETGLESPGFGFGANIKIHNSRLSGKMCVETEEATLAKFYYGGQAVIEGVMMRGQRHMAVAVRAPGGKIIVRREALNAAIYKHPIMKMPFLRGFVALWDALGLGIKALMFSADVALQEESSDSGPPSTTGSDQPVIENPEPKAQPSLSGPVAWTSIAIAVGMMVTIFFVLPVLAAGLITGVAGLSSNIAHNLIEGAIRLAFFIGYIWAIGRMPDIQRVFGYHGAEHKTINAYEAGVELTPERVQSFTLLNPRCGTTFLLIVLLFATLVFVLIGKLPFALMVLSRIVLVPVIAAIAYEFIRLMANLYDHALIRAIMAPGLALQKMTTRPPDLSMVEVGIAALTSVLVADGVLQEAEAALRSPQEEAGEPSVALA